MLVALETLRRCRRAPRRRRRLLQRHRRGVLRRRRLRRRRPRRQGRRRHLRRADRLRRLGRLPRLADPRHHHPGAPRARRDGAAALARRRRRQRHRQAAPRPRRRRAPQRRVARAGRPSAPLRQPGDHRAHGRARRRVGDHLPGELHAHLRGDVPADPPRRRRARAGRSRPRSRTGSSAPWPWTRGSRSTRCSGSGTATSCPPRCRTTTRSSPRAWRPAPPSAAPAASRASTRGTTARRSRAAAARRPSASAPGYGSTAHTIDEWVTADDLVDHVAATALLADALVRGRRSERGRRFQLTQTQNDLRPGFVELAFGEPDPGLLPLDAVRRAAARRSTRDGPARSPTASPRGRTPCAPRWRSGSRRGKACRSAPTRWSSPAATRRPSSRRSPRSPTRATSSSSSRRPTTSRCAIAARPPGRDRRRAARRRGARRRRPRGDPGAPARRAAAVPVCSTRSRPFTTRPGACLSAERRAALVALARREDLLLVEDDVYRELVYDGEAPPSLWSLDPEAPVLRLGTFSKSLTPGPARRLGDGPRGPAPALHRHGHDRERRLPEPVRGDAWRRRCSTAATTRPTSPPCAPPTAPAATPSPPPCATHLPAGCDFVVPAGGYFLWLRLPAGSHGHGAARRTPSDTGSRSSPAGASRPTARTTTSASPSASTTRRRWPRAAGASPRRSRGARRERCSAGPLRPARSAPQRPALLRLDLAQAGRDARQPVLEHVRGAGEADPQPALHAEVAAGDDERAVAVEEALRQLRRPDAVIEVHEGCRAGTRRDVVEARLGGDPLGETARVRAHDAEVALEQPRPVLQGQLPEKLVEQAAADGRVVAPVGARGDELRPAPRPSPAGSRRASRPSTCCPCSRPCSYRSATEGVVTSGSCSSPRYTSSAIDPGAAPVGDLDDALEQGGVDERPRGVVRVVEDDHAGAVVDEAGELVDVGDEAVLGAQSQRLDQGAERGRHGEQLLVGRA